MAFVHDSLLDRREHWPKDVDVLYVPPATHLELMSLGYKEALADLIWVRALLFTGQRIGDNDLEVVGRYVEAITGLSPRFHQAYRWGGVTMIYGGQADIDRPAVDRAIAIYERGLEQFPESHELLYPMGMLLTHQVGSTPGYSDEEREAMSRRGVEYIRKAAAFGADPLVRQYAATLITEHGTEQLAVQFLESQLAQAEDEGYRRMLRRKLERMGQGQTAQQAEAVREAFRAEHDARAPYVPEALYTVIRSEHAVLPETTERSN